MVPRIDVSLVPRLLTGILFWSGIAGLAMGQANLESTAALITVPAAFRLLDADEDGVLTEPEFVNGGGQQTRTLHRDFVVFDADGNGRMTPQEFLTIPYFTLEDQLAPLPDPVIMLSRAYFQVVCDHWQDWDNDSDGTLSSDEFTKADIGRNVLGLESTEFADWDRNRDGTMTQDDAALLLDIACGVRYPTGDLLRSGSGKILDCVMFRSLNPDENGTAKRENYLRNVGANAAMWFPKIHEEGYEQFNIAQFSTSGHRVDSVAMFLSLDADLDSQLKPDELLGLPDGWGAAASSSYKLGFDNDANGSYSLYEFMLIPQINLYRRWDAAVDRDGDGRLSRSEFQFLPGPELAALSAEYFRRFDVDRDGTLSLDEWNFQTTNPKTKFESLDKDADGDLTFAEFNAEGSPPDRLRRDFHVFDADQNQRISVTEFLAIPYWASEDFRISFPDPVVQLAESQRSDIDQHWAQWDLDHNDVLDPAEFSVAQIPRRVKGLQTTGFSIWDLDHNGTISHDEAGLVLDTAFGVRTPHGEFLRTKAGSVLDWRSFLQWNPDSMGKVSRSMYINLKGSLEEAELSFPGITALGSDKFGIKEFARSTHRVDLVSVFLNLDADLNGKVSATELTNLPPGWGPPGIYWFPGFDDDRDNVYSLSEFMLIPHVNLLTTWHSATDNDHDGRLSREEFRFMNKPALAALTAEYFGRLDINQDGFLSHDEWWFPDSPSPVPFNPVVTLMPQTTRLTRPTSAPIATYLGLTSPSIRKYVICEVAVVLFVITGFRVYRKRMRKYPSSKPKNE